VIAKSLTPSNPPNPNPPNSPPGRVEERPVLVADHVPDLVGSRPTPVVHPRLEPLTPRPAPANQRARGHVLAGEGDEGPPHPGTHPTAPGPH
jgi:hypothetical protein